MPDPDRLRRLLDLYCRAMGDFIRTRLHAALGAKWWDDGVLAALDTTQRAALRDQQMRSPDADRTHLLNPAQITAVVVRNFDNAFAPDFREGKERTRALMESVNRGRIKLANRQPFSDQEAAAFLQAMARTLRSAGCAREATAVEAAAPSLGG